MLEKLVERGLVEARGEKRARVYHLAASLYRRLGQSQAYVRSRGFDRVQRRQMVLNLVEAEGRITRAKAAELCQITEPQAYHLLSKMVKDKELEMIGRGRGAYYVKERT